MLARGVRPPTNFGQTGNRDGRHLHMHDNRHVPPPAGRRLDLDRDGIGADAVPRRNLGRHRDRAAAGSTSSTATAAVAASRAATVAACRRSAQVGIVATNTTTGNSSRATAVTHSIATKPCSRSAIFTAYP